MVEETPKNTRRLTREECTCMCHTDPKVRHFVACCGPASLPKSIFDNTVNAASHKEAVDIIKLYYDVVDIINDGPDDSDLTMAMAKIAEAQKRARTFLKLDVVKRDTDNVQ